MDSILFFCHRKKSGTASFFSLFPFFCPRKKSGTPSFFSLFFFSALEKNQGQTPNFYFDKEGDHLFISKWDDHNQNYQCLKLWHTIRSSFHSERDSGIGGITIGPVTRNRGSNGDMIIGNTEHLSYIQVMKITTTIIWWWSMSWWSLSWWLLGMMITWWSRVQAINLRWTWTPC